MDHQKKYLSTSEPVSTGLSPRDALGCRGKFPGKYCSWLTTFQDLGTQSKIKMDVLSHPTMI